MKIQDLKRDSLHHAYLVQGDVSVLGQLVSSIESIFDVKLAANPDALILSEVALTVGAARKAVERASSAALVSGNSKILIIAFEQVTLEAQNALLKTLEEPAKGTHIFMLTPSPSMLLPTVLSRCMQVFFDDDVPDDTAVDFINSTLQERIKTIEKLVKKKDKPAMLQLLSGLESYLSENKPSDIDETGAWTLSTDAVLQAKAYIRDKGAMSKMLMESVALVV